MIETFRIVARKYHNALLFLAFAILSYALIVIIVREKLDNLHSLIQLHISDQQSLLKTIAEITARNGADVVTESIIRDCSVNERTEFDTLLDKLDKGLVKSDLEKLDRLFGRCASFYPQRKSVMVARFSREIEVYSSYVDQLKTISDKETVASYNVDTWQQLASQEKKQSELFVKMTTLQETIITTLISGKTSDSKEIKDVLKEVKEVQQGLVEASAEAAQIRSELIKI